MSVKYFFYIGGLYMTFVGKYPLGTKEVINNQGMEHANAFTSLGCNLCHTHPEDIGNNLGIFQQLLKTIRNTLFIKDVQQYQIFTVVISTSLRGVR